MSSLSDEKLQLAIEIVRSSFGDGLSLSDDAIKLALEKQLFQALTKPTPMAIKTLIGKRPSIERLPLTVDVDTKANPMIPSPGSYREPGKVSVDEILACNGMEFSRVIFIHPPEEGLTPEQEDLLRQLNGAQDTYRFTVLLGTAPVKRSIWARIVGFFSRRKPEEGKEEWDISQACDVCYGNGYVPLLGDAPREPCPVCHPHPCPACNGEG